jgi:hypothetical protein
MSMMLCCKCDNPVDTDEDPDSLYCIGYDYSCVCKDCREEFYIKTIFDEEEITQK